MILLAHWLAGVSGMQLQPYPLSIAFDHNSTLELQYKELVTNVASSSSGFILNFDIPSYMWKSQIASAFLPANSIIYFLHQTSKDVMLQDVITKTILERWIGGKAKDPSFKWDALVQCL